MLRVCTETYNRPMKTEVNVELKRRVPQRPSGELRVAVLLDAAAAVIADVGYEAATMTAIALKAKSSIGTVYQYYRDKTAIADALCHKLGGELSEELGSFADTAQALPVRKMVIQLVQIVTDFTSRQPALFLVLGVTSAHEKKPVVRRRLRLRLARLYQAKVETMTDAEAYRIASVTLEILKDLYPLTSEASASQQHLFQEEIATVLTTYLDFKLR